MDVKVIGLSLPLLLLSCDNSVEQFSTEDASSHLSGVKFYEQRCDVCHGSDGKLGVSDAKDLSSSKLSVEQIQKIVKEGKGAMPPFGYAIESDSTLYELIEHLTSLRE